MLGTLCLLDTEPRALNQREVRLLEAMADDLMDLLGAKVIEWGDPAPVAPPTGTSGATVGQVIPAA